MVKIVYGWCLQSMSQLLYAFIIHFNAFSLSLFVIFELHVNMFITLNDIYKMIELVQKKYN
jgi:hypothetical protein